MRKIFFTLIGVLLLSTTAFGSDVLFKMENLQTTGTLSTNAEGVIFTDGKCNLNPYVFLIGGTAELYKSTEYDFIKNGCIRVYTKTGYLHIHLDRPLLATDVISYTDNGQSANNDLYVTTTASRTSGNLVSPSSPLTATNLEGAQDLYFWYGSLSESARHIQSLTITTNDPEVVYYDFENETTGEFSQVDEVTLNNGLKVNSNLESGRSSIVAQSIAGFTKVLNIAGDGINRALKLSVTDPCTIEFWAISANATDRSLYITDDSSDLDKYTLYTSTDDNKTKLHRCTFRHDALADNTTYIISPSSGSWKIAAIRVIYDKIRPVPGLTLDKPTLTIRSGRKDSVRITSLSTGTITRSRNSAAVKVSQFDLHV